MLEAGSKAPGFSGITQSNETISLKDFAGKNVLLYFYPKDNTPGCTKQACSLRDHFKEITDRNTVIIGVSADSVKRHQNFIEKYDLPFYLIADEDHSVLEAYEAWGEKKNYGRTYMGIIRMSYLIGPDGIIKHTWPKVKTAEHGKEVLAILDS